VPEFEYKGRDAQEMLQKWMNALYWALPSDCPVKEERQDYSDRLENATALDNPITYEGNARNVLSNATRILLDAYRVLFGVRLEGVAGEDKAFKARTPKGTATTESHYPGRQRLRLRLQDASGQLEHPARRARLGVKRPDHARLRER
jgi:hypothetical protein